LFFKLLLANVIWEYSVARFYVSELAAEAHEITYTI